MNINYDVYGNERHIWICEQCKKQRVLSVAEFEDDGWKCLSARTGAVICKSCQPTYGIPCNLLRPMNYSGLGIDENGNVCQKMMFGDGK